MYFLLPWNLSKWSLKRSFWVHLQLLQTQMKRTKEEFHQMIQARIRKSEEIKNSVELSKVSFSFLGSLFFVCLFCYFMFWSILTYVYLQINKERETETSVELFTMVIGAFQRNHDLLLAEIEQKQEAVERRAEEFLQELGQEIDDLQNKCNEMQYLECTEDSLHLVEVRPAYYCSRFKKLY